MNNNENKNKEKLGTLGILLTALLWGYSFVAVKVVVEEISSFYLVGFRNLLGGVFLALIFFKHTKKTKLKDILLSLPVGTALFLGFFLQTTAAQFITASKVAFFTGSNVIFVPFLSWIIYKKKPRLSSFIAAFITIIGLYFLSFANGLEEVKIGDLFALLCAIAFAVHLILIDASLKHVDGISLAVWQLIIAGIISLSFALITKTRLNIEIISNEAIISFLYLAIFGSGIAYLLQTVSQKYVSASKTSVLLNMEAFLGALCSVIFMKDSLTFNFVIGGICVISAIFICEIGSDANNSNNIKKEIINNNKI